MSGNGDIGRNGLTDRALLELILEQSTRTATKSDLKDVQRDVRALGDRMQRVESTVAFSQKIQAQTQAKADKNEEALAELRGKESAFKAMLGAVSAVIVGVLIWLFTEGKGK